jgi:hypothetical protein
MSIDVLALQARLIRRRRHLVEYGSVPPTWVRHHLGTPLFEAPLPAVTVGD